MQGIRILGGHIAHNTLETASDRAPADAFRSSALRFLKVPLVPFSEILLRGGRVCNGKGCSCLSLASFSASTGSKAHDAAALAGCMQSTWAAHREGRHAGLSGGRATHLIGFVAMGPLRAVDARFVNLLLPLPQQLSSVVGERRPVPLALLSEFSVQVGTS